MSRTSWGTRYSIAASTLALLLALGGTAYAVNTVRSADIVDGTIKTQDIGTGAVQSIDIKNGTVAPADLTAGTLGRTPTVMARVNGDGTVAISRGGVTVTPLTTGNYLVDAGRDITNCLEQATARERLVTVAVEPGSSTNVSVYVVTTSGTPVARAFDIVFFC
jgi:hypothetical protein